MSTDEDRPQTDERPRRSKAHGSDAMTNRITALAALLALLISLFSAYRAYAPLKEVQFIAESRAAFAAGEEEGTVEATLEANIFFSNMGNLHAVYLGAAMAWLPLDEDLGRDGTCRRIVSERLYATTDYPIQPAIGEDGTSRYTTSLIPPREASQFTETFPRRTITLEEGLTPCLFITVMDYDGNSYRRSFAVNTPVEALLRTIRPNVEFSTRAVTNPEVIVPARSWWHTLLRLIGF